MENASKALIMAGGVLIAIIILSLGVYLFDIMGKYADNTQNEINESNLAQFNNKFLKYNGLKDLTIQDIITVRNYALESNRKYTGYNYINDRAGTNNDYIDVYYSINGGTDTLAFRVKDEILLRNLIDKKFTCTVNLNAETGRVTSVFFDEM